MAKIYTMPQGIERRKKLKKIQSDRTQHQAKNSADKRLSLKRILTACWYCVRCAIAAVLHVTAVCFLAVLGAFSKVLFWLGGLMCVVTWFANEHRLWSTDNFTIPVIASLWLLSLVATPMLESLYAKTPFHNFLALTPENKQDGI